MAELEQVIGHLVDAADAYDSDSLTFDAACEIHGDRAVSNATCICRGQRYTASEFVQTLQLYVRDRDRRRMPAGRPNAQRSHDPRVNLAIAG